MVEIQYKLRHIGVEVILRLADKDYFDPLGLSETYSKDGIPRFSRLSGYISNNEATIEWARVAIPGDFGATKRFEQYSTDGRVLVWQRDDPDGRGELCVETRLDNTRTHLARFHLDAARNWRPNYIGVFTDLPDGSQIEDKILPCAR